MKKVLFLMFLSLIVLSACGKENKEESIKDPNMSIEEQEKILKKETKKLGIVLVDTTAKEDVVDISKDDLDKLDNAIKTFENNTADIKDIDTSISDPIYKVANISSIAAKNIQKVGKFKDNNPDLTETYNLANGDIYYHLVLVMNTIDMEYEDVDAEYKNDFLGKKLNSDITDMIFSEDDLVDFTDGFGNLAFDYSEQMTDEQLKELPDTAYREQLKKFAYFDEEDVSKNEYNKSVDEYNELTPEFLHYKKVNHMVSADENISMINLRNGLVSAGTDSEVE